MKIGFDHLPFIIQCDIKILHTEFPKLFHYDLDDRFVTQRNQGFGQDASKRVQAGALAPGHNDYGISEGRPTIFSFDAVETLSGDYVQ